MNRKMWGIIKNTNICKILQGEEGGERAEKIFEVVVAKNIPNLV